MNSSEFYDFLTTRMSVREYNDAEENPVTDEEIEYILRCAQRAPSAGNLESWDVVIVTDESVKEELSDAAFGQEHIRKRRHCHRADRTLHGYMRGFQCPAAEGGIPGSHNPGQQRLLCRRNA